MDIEGGLMDGIHFTVTLSGSVLCASIFCTLVAGATFWIAWGIGLPVFLSATAVGVAFWRGIAQCSDEYWTTSYRNSLCQSSS